MRQIREMDDNIIESVDNERNPMELDTPPRCCVTSPHQFSLKDWWVIGKRSYAEIDEDNVAIVSAGIAFFSMLAIFPMITAGLSIYGMFADPVAAQQQLNAIAEPFPPDVWSLINDQVQSVIGSSNKAIGWKIILGIIASLWASGAGIRAMVRGLNIAYGEVDRRNVFVKTGMGLIFTLGTVMMMLISLTVIIGVPAALALLRFDGEVASLAKILPWSFLLFAFMVGCTILYRYGPNRRPAKLRWVIPGAIFATVAWLVISMCFSKFVSAFGTYNKTYGSLGAVIVLLVWLWLSNFIVMMGAEINGEMERHTDQDTTRGPDRPIGQRGAAMADYEARKL